MSQPICAGKRTLLLLALIALGLLLLVNNCEGSFKRSFANSTTQFAAHRLYERAVTCDGSCGLCIASCCNGDCLTTCAGAVDCDISCPSGQYVGSGGCFYCPENTYKSGFNSIKTCVSCPAGSTSGGSTGLQSVADCVPNANFVYDGNGAFVCKPGYSYVSGDCVECPIGSYKILAGNGDCVSDCPTHATTNGSMTAAVGPNGACSCYQGYYGLSATSDTLCSACPIDTYKDTTGNGAMSLVCNSCPVGTTTNGRVGQTSVKGCVLKDSFWVPAVENSSVVPYVCPAGYSLNVTTGNCTLCPLGTFKPNPGNSACTPCPAYSIAKSGFTAGGALSANEACSCSASSTSMSMSWPMCIPCAIGTYSSGGSCVSCPTGSTSSIGSTTCTAKPGWIDTGSLTFTCAAGYAWLTSAQDCAPCGPGSYKTTSGNSSCVSCVNQRNGPSGAIASQSFSVACSCNAGYYDPGSATNCTACSSATYRASGEANSCTSCTTWAGSSFSPVTSADMCLQSSNGVLSGSTCPAGQYKSGGSTCSACAAGTYSFATSGNTVCYSCPSTNCTSLPLGSAITNPLSACSCRAGTYPIFSSGQLTECLVCPANTFSPYSGSASQASCLSCGNASTSSLGATDCTPVANAVRSGFNTFSCLPGYTYNYVTNTCTSCASGTYKPSMGNQVCTQCPDGSVASGLTGQSTAAGACTCSAGHFGLSSGYSFCALCPFGTYKSSSGNGNVGTCSACASGLNSTANGTACVPNAGYTSSGVCSPGYGYNSITSTCLLCTSGSYKSTAGNVTCTSCPSSAILGVTGATNAEEACMCDGGNFYNTSISSCSFCPANTFKQDVANDACSHCLPYATTLGVTGSLNKSSCICGPGYYLGASMSSCIGCGLNKYKSVNSDNSSFCYSCPGLTTTNRVNNAMSLTQCQCPAGYYGDNVGGCTMCPVDQYKPWGNSIGCTWCPWGTTTGANRGSVSLANCSVRPNFISDGNGNYVCVAGYYPSNSQCVPCPSDYYKSSNGNMSCIGCSSGTTTRGRTGLTGCLNPTTTYYYDPVLSGSSQAAASAGGPIAGAVIGCLAFTVFTAATAYYYIQKRNRLSEKRMPSKPSSSANTQRVITHAGHFNGSNVNNSQTYTSKSHSSNGSLNQSRNGTGNVANNSSGTAGMNNATNNSVPSNTVSNTSAANNKNWNFATSGFQPILAPSSNAGNWRTPNVGGSAMNATWNNSNIESTIFSVSAMSMILMTRTQVISEGPIVAFPAFLTVDADSGYRKLKKLGEGGFAVLYKGELLDTSVCQTPDMANKNTAIVAIKVFKTSQHEDEKSDIIAEFENEASIMYALQSSPNIAKLYALACKPDLALMMKLYDESVARMIHSPNSALMPKLMATTGGSYMRVIAVLVHDLTNAVKFMHAAGVAHLDLKPGNMLIESVRPNDAPTPTGFPFRLVVCDFGLAKLISETNVVRGRRKNLAHGLSIHYAAPEAFRIVRMMENGCIVSPQSLFKMDVFSLSSSVYEFAYKQVPFGKASFQEVEAALNKGQRPVRNNPSYMPSSGRELSIWKDMCTIVDLGWPQNPMNRADLDVIWDLLNVTVKSAGFSPTAVRYNSLTALTPAGNSAMADCTASEMVSAERGAPLPALPNNSAARSSTMPRLRQEVISAGDFGPPPTIYSETPLGTNRRHSSKKELRASLIGDVKKLFGRHNDVQVPKANPSQSKDKVCSGSGGELPGEEESKASPERADAQLESGGALNEKLGLFGFVARRKPRE